ncbi:Ig-like domain-containing protein [Thalassotalea euphylliae]|uniref:Ig-like domain-containing protein n=1 Tax=Thalassotalea euphylliae TaxID=1655234 RepID=UPI00362E926F
MELFRRLSFTMLLLTLVACGGGDGGLSNGDNPDPGDDNQTDPITISLSLSSSDVSATSPIELTATVTQDNEPVANKLVTFGVNDPELALFNPENGAASTNEEGIATIQVVVGTKAGAGELTASVTEESGDSVSSSIVFSSAGDGDAVSGPEVSTLTIFAESQQIASSGAQQVKITALVKDANNNLVEGASVSFSATSGQIEVEKAVTEADGLASAVLKTSNEPENRVITVAASSNIVSDEVDVQVVGTSIQLSGSSALAIGDETSYVLNLLDSDGNGISNQTVNLSLTNADGAQIDIPESVTTDFTGQALFNATGVTGGSNAIRAESLGASASLTASVQSDSFLFTLFDNGEVPAVDPSSSAVPDVGLSSSAEITLTWLRDGSPVPDGTPVEFTTTRGIVSTSNGTTVNGQATVTIQASDAGLAVVTFTGNDGDISLSNQLSFEFIAETVDTIVAQASPASVEPSGDTSVISVTVRDANDNLVKGKVIDFTLDDTNGGSIFPATAITDSSGNASTVYTSNAVSSQDGVTVTATVRDNPAKQDSVHLTVAGRELFLTLGTGNTLEEPDQTIYNKQYSVFVTDADSAPVENVNITVTAIPKYYYKGYWTKSFDETGSFVAWVPTSDNPDTDDIFEESSTPPFDLTRCENEDRNFNGILDEGEDTNEDGILTPGNVVSATGEVTTDSQGRAIIDIRYPQSYGLWADIDLQVTARVTGTESSEFTLFTLDVLASDVTDEDVTPPTQGVGLKGPFGGIQDCSTAE